MKDDLDYYLSQDHAARQRTMIISVIAGAVAGVIAQLTNVSAGLTFGICVLTVAAIELGGVFGYRKASHVSRRAAVLPLRRYVIRSVFSAASIFVLALLRIPHIEAAVVDRRLREMTNEDPPPFEKVNALVNSAIQNGIPIPEKSIAAAKYQILRATTAAASSPTSPTESPATATLAHLEAYTLYDVAGVRLRLSSAILFSADTFTLHAPVFVPFSPSAIGAARNATVISVQFKRTEEAAAALNYGPMRSDALVGRMTATGQSLALSDAPEFVLKAANDSYKLAVLEITISNLRQTLDGLVWVDVVFDRCFIVYRGGPISIDGVAFRDCQFSASDETSEKVLDYIRSQEGNPVTLHRP